MAGAEIVVRITGDSPFVDPRIIDLAIAEYFDRARGEQAPDCLKTRGFPLGINVEVFTAEALGRAARLAKTRREREHVTLGMYERPDVFSVSTVDAEADRSEMRWTVDTPEDLLFARTVFSLLERVDFSWRDVMALVDADPSLAAINAHIRQRVPDPKRHARHPPAALAVGTAPRAVRTLGKITPPGAPGRYELAPQAQRRSVATKEESIVRWL